MARIISENSRQRTPYLAADNEAARHMLNKREIFMDNNQKVTIKSFDNSVNEYMRKIGSLNNYNDTYDFLVNLVKENDNILDLACGPAQISSYILNKVNVNVTGVDLSGEMLKIAKSNVPGGVFIEDSIITFNNKMEYELIIIGFGIPYLNMDQVKECIANCASMLKADGNVYISFMEGLSHGFEKTSFGGNNEFFIYYHGKEAIINILEGYGIKIVKTFELDYMETDGRITKDVVIIGENNSD